MAQLLDVVNAVNQKGQHAILFGERGVGKTSLARVLSRGITIGSQNLLVASINCDPTMTFSSLWHQVLREISLTTQSQGIGFTATPVTQNYPINQQLPETVTPDDIRHLFSRLPKSLIVIDELDRLTDEKTTGLLSDTIKTLSDHAVDVTLLLVGVADSVDALIKEHQSVERALVQIRMPRMSKPELFEIIDKGLQTASMTIDEEAKNKIAVLSQGLPHYTHLLALYAAQRSALTDRTHVEMSDVRSAIDNALARAQQSIISAHHKSTSSSRDNLYPQVLLACALSQQDSLGYFTSVDVRQPLSEIMKRHYDIPAFSQHLNAFCDVSRGPILQKTGTSRRFRFRFCNPLMQPFVIMDGIKRGLITEASIKG
jgi:Cdc6-like AAA superfamily ATPase